MNAFSLGDDNVRYTHVDVLSINKKKCKTIMNSWKLNSLSGHLVRTAICKYFNISHIDIYKKVQEINGQTIIVDNKKYKLTLEEIK